MVKSMTGFGRGEIKDKGFYINIEIKSVNHRFLDIIYRLPKPISSLEDRIRNMLTDRISRGRLEINVVFEMHDKSINELEIDMELLKQYIDIFSFAKSNFELSGDIKINDILMLPDVIKIKNTDVDLEEVWDVLKVALEESINNLIDMRIKEGIKLYNDIISRLDAMEEIINDIDKMSYTVIDGYRKKLESRIQELVNENVDPNRIMTEIAIIADRSCIAEEVTRLKCHIAQFRESVESNYPVGKKLDFITQEMNREANTIGSKSLNYEISKNIIELKNEIEKIREQVQNIE